MFDVARRCQGASSVASFGVFLARASVDAARVAATTFSLIMREYSAGEHVPRAIMSVRWRIVSHDARVSSASRRGSGVFRFRLGMG